MKLSREVEDLIVADLALSVAFALVTLGGLAGLQAGPVAFVSAFVVSLIAVSFAFVLHELMHKFVAQHFGAVAAFRKSDSGILITLLSGLVGFLIGIPGATVIYASNFTRDEEGYVSIAGPLTNFAVFIAFFALYLVSPRVAFLEDVLGTTMLISLILAFFNMLPLYPLDGSKVLRWNKPVYFATVALIFVFLITVYPLVTGITVWSLVAGLALMFVFAMAISFFVRRAIF